MQEGIAITHKHVRALHLYAQPTAETYLRTVPIAFASLPQHWDPRRTRPVFS